MLLLLDANMLLGILQSGGTSDIHSALSRWISNMLNDAEFKPRGKAIILFVSTGIFRDYRSALGRRQYHINTYSWATFRKSVHRRRQVGDGTYFSTCKITGQDGTADRGWGGDKYDRACFEALQGAFSAERFGEYRIVFASNDGPTCAEVERDFLGKRDERLHVVGGKESHESLIME